MAGCVHARVANIQPVQRPNDQQLTCDQITLEYKSNTEIAGAKIEKNENADTRDFWLGVFVWPGLMDLQNADGNEGNALLDRNICASWQNRNHAPIFKVGLCSPSDIRRTITSFSCLQVETKGQSTTSKKISARQAFQSRRHTVGSSRWL
jgi:hypothetical protein